MSNTDQFELYENAKKRLKQKRRLYLHFILFLIGSVFLIAINKLLNVGEQYDWFVWAIFGWLFLFLLHFVNVFFTNKFMGKEWEQKQTQKLIKKQEDKIAKIQKKLDKEYNIKMESEAYAAELKKKELEKEHKPNNNQINE